MAENSLRESSVAEQDAALADTEEHLPYAPAGWWWPEVRPGRCLSIARAAGLRSNRSRVVSYWGG